MKVGRAVVYLAYDVYKNICEWWNGEITGKRCIKNIIDSGLTIGAGMAGGVAGVAFGSIFGPVGTVIGGITGGVLSSAAISVLSDYLTQKIFGIPKEKALENAYNFLDVNMTASNHDINTAFRKLCLKYHPDKGGNIDEFLKLQFHMTVIKGARGDF